ncbi:helix-turn-helix domain-containing protein [Polaromonas sp. JS666]|uniref:helix-turn-helix domain-containing protein n=1 Tax=Polaromonas sp. (strain JS666 / ATCC BAA-500) TaxID=296591 RepID=UPI00005328DA|nr:helix-turn-helix domain-containing protein [Polaromonas sp. JS666]ABE46883.1 transcriptional regulator, XRE family [Polaromonas sp. JS666]
MTNVEITSKPKGQSLPSQKFLKPPTEADRRTEDALVRLGQRVSHARRVRNWTQTELAGLADMGLSTVVAIESGKAGVGMRNFLRVLDALGMLDHFDSVLDPARDEMLVQHGIDSLPKRAKANRRRR